MFGRSFGQIPVRIQAQDAHILNPIPESLKNLGICPVFWVILRRCQMVPKIDTPPTLGDDLSVA